MKLVINDPIIKSYRPNVSDWVKLIAITREQLCHQTYNPTAYLKQNGPDAQSLKVISPNQNKDLLLIRYDADKKVATVFINWSLYEMHQAVQQMLICISGNHNVDIEVTMQVVHPKKNPNIQLVNKTASCIWGTTNVANLIVRGTVDGGHDSWKYSCLTKVFIEKVDGFYISGQREEIYDGKKGYIIKLNQWEQKSIAIKYDYARGFINNDLQRKLPLYFIYYTVNRVGSQNVNRHDIDEFVVTFTPLQPIIAVKMKRLQKEYVIGTTDVNLFEVTLTKQDGHAQNIEGLSLISQDTRININKVNDTYLVSLNAPSFKDLPSSNVEIELKATARNANSVSEYIVLSTDRLDNDRSILLKRKRLIDIKDNSEIKNNGRVILYKGNSPTQYLLYLRNISSSVLGTGLTLNNIKIEVRSDLGISFSNGRTRENIARLQDGSFSTLKINVHPYSVPSIKDVSIVVTSDFSEPLILTAKVETKDKINPQICFDFEKEVDLYSVDSKDFKPIQYNNLQIGTLFIKTEEIPDDQLNNYESYSFQDHSIEIIDNEKISLKSTSQGTILKPGDILRIGVLLTGDVSTGEHFIVKSGCNEKIITLPVTKKIYNLPIVDFSPANGDCIFEYCEKERLYIGEFIPQFQESANNDDVDCVMNISKPFCFENGSFEIPITKTSSPVKLYFLLSEEFGGVKNICNNKSFPLILSLLSPVFCEKKEANYGNIIIKSIIAKASPFVELRFEQEPDENKHIAVKYSEIWFTDSKNMICELVLRNTTSLPYSPNENCENDYVEFSDICIEDEDGLILFDKPEKIIIENGQHDVVFPVYIDCEKWQGQKKQIKISCDITIGTSTSPAEPLGEDYYIEFIEQRNDNIYSLDLGTTGIVMAKQEDFEISTIELQDDGDARNQHIEENSDIISSITIINEETLKNTKGTEKECHQILISPRRKDYKSNAKFIFVPAKFMVGQKRIPYINRCLHDIPFVAFDPNLTTWENASDDFVYTLDANEDGYYLTPEIFLQLTYENILNRCSERENIKKLILTYPNTYTNNVLDELRNLISTKLDDLSGFVDMVPESDAVVAFYFNERINYYGADPQIINERKINIGTERILIYDMGAGTLDLSLVTITRNQNTNRVSADIEKKIGIPIAGNYLDWVLYDSYFKDKLKDDTNKTLKNLKDYIKQIKQLYTSTEKKDKLPEDGANECLKELYANDLQNEELTDDSITFEKIDSSIEEYIKVCSETILTVFLGKDIKVDRLVYSGRGSQFGPLRTAVQKFLRDRNHDLIVDKTIENCDLKTCVAKGALCYNDLFGVDSDHRITNRNQHLNLGVVYIAPAQDGSANEIYYKEIIHPDDGLWEEDAKLIDGTWWRHFDNTIYIDLSVKNKKVYFIQTLLDAEQIKSLYRKVYSNPNTKRTELEWVFINELFSFNTNTLTQHNRDKIAVNISIDEENNINYSVGGRFPRGEKLVDRIENNIFYQHGMWPYVIFEN